MIDLTHLTDGELSAHLEAVLAERDRRERLATIPAQVTALAASYLSGGGERATLEVAIASAVRAEPGTAPAE